MHNQGLTIIEVLIALIIIAVAFMALALSQISSMRVTRDSQVASIATQVANAAMEGVVKQLLEEEFTCGSVTLPCTGTRNNIEVEGRTYASTYTITVPAGATYQLAGLARVDVTVANPANITLSQFVSCMDVVPAPSFGNPAPCPG